MGPGRRALHRVPPDGEAAHLVQGPAYEIPAGFVVLSVEVLEGHGKVRGGRTHGKRERRTARRAGGQQKCAGGSPQNGPARIATRAQVGPSVFGRRLVMAIDLPAGMQSPAPGGADLEVVLAARLDSPDLEGVLLPLGFAKDRSVFVDPVTAPLVSLGGTRGAVTRSTKTLRSLANPSGSDAPSRSGESSLAASTTSEVLPQPLVPERGPGWQIDGHYESRPKDRRPDLGSRGDPG